MTFGAAGDTTVVRTFPYGVPEGADSLVRLSFGADDTVRHVPGRLLPTDSLPEPFSPVLPADTVSAADIYGPVSFVPVAGAPEPCGIPVTFGVGYQMLTVLLLLFYLLLVFRAGGHAARMMRAVWGRGGEGKHRHDGDMPGAEVQALILACGLLMCGLAAVKSLNCGKSGGGFPPLCGAEGGSSCRRSCWCCSPSWGYSRRSCMSSGNLPSARNSSGCFAPSVSRCSLP